MKGTRGNRVEILSTVRYRGGYGANGNRIMCGLRQQDRIIDRGNDLRW